MKDSAHDKLFAACGIAFVVLTMAGALIAMAGGSTHSLTVSSSTAKVAAVFARPQSARVWVGAYVGLIGLGAFVGFAVWALARLDDGLWAAIGRTTAGAYVAVNVVSTGVMGAMAYRTGHRIGVGLGRTLVAVNEGIYVASWFLTAFFLVAVAVPALAAGRRLLGWGALAVVAYTLVATPLSFDGAGQFSVLLFFAWVLAASVALLRRAPRPTVVPAPA